MLQPLAAQDQRPTGHQPVDVVAIADTQLHLLIPQSHSAGMEVGDLIWRREDL